MSQNEIEIWRETIGGLVTDRGALRLPHINNLLTKLGLPSATEEGWLQVFRELIPAYTDFHHCLFANPEEATIEKAVVAVNRYLNLLKGEQFKIFRHQSDFASSVLPEFFCGIFGQIIATANYPYQIASQGDLIIDCVFDAHEGGRLVLKKKRVDFALLLEAELSFRGTVKSDFRIPVLAMEIKTNLDKNMLSGIESSVESLKRTFPNCLYLIVAELADFDTQKQNYSATYIDEIYILRKQKRSAVRLGGGIQEIDIDLMKEITTRTLAHLAATSADVISIKDRAKEGALIGGKGRVSDGENRDC